MDHKKFTVSQQNTAFLLCPDIASLNLKKKKEI